MSQTSFRRLEGFPIEFGPDKLAPKLGENFGLVGSIGSGKTYFAKRVILPEFPRVLIVDSEHMEFGDWPPIRADVRPRTIAAHIGKSALEMRQFHWRLNVPSPRRVNRSAWFDRLCWELLAKPRLSLLVYVDEVSDLCSSAVIGPGFRDLLRRGRKRGCCVVWGTQRPQLVNKTAWNLSVHKSIFYIDQFDRRYLDDLGRGADVKLSDLIGRIPYRSFRSLYLGPGRVEEMEAA